MIKRTQSFLLLTTAAGLTPFILVMSFATLEKLEAPPLLGFAALAVSILPLFIVGHYTTNFPTMETRSSDGTDRLGISGTFIAMTLGIFIGGLITLELPTL